MSADDAALSDTSGTVCGEDGDDSNSYPELIDSSETDATALSGPRADGGFLCVLHNLISVISF